jgi:hypothetical protein
MATKLFTVFYTDDTDGEAEQCRTEVMAESAEAARAEVESWGATVEAVI